jgi:hypothetical protein
MKKLITIAFVMSACVGDSDVDLATATSDVHSPRPRGVPGQMTVEWSNIVATPGCMFLSGPGNLGSEYSLGTKAKFKFGPGFSSVVTFEGTTPFVGPSFGSPISLTRATTTCPLWGEEFGFDEEFRGSWGSPSPFGLSFRGTYQYRECVRLEDGSCEDDGCWIDADVVVRPRLTTDVDVPFVPPADECARSCAHDAAVVAAVTATGCALQGTPTETECLAACARSFNGTCDREAYALTECEIAIPTNEYGCVHLPTKDVLGSPNKCSNELGIFQACRFKEEPTGLCVTE